MVGDERVRPARTVLEREIRDRRLTYEEFVEFAERFGREHGEAGTLSVRHVQRLAAGRVGVPRPATARLLERIFGQGIEELLAEPPTAVVRPMPLRVAVAIVVKGMELLVVRRHGDGEGVDAWQFPAGIIKPGRSVTRVAIEETAKETGVQAAVVRTLGGRIHPRTSVCCEYVLCEYIAGSASNIDPLENLGVAWIDRTALAGVIPLSEIFPPVVAAVGLAHKAG